MYASMSKTKVLFFGFPGDVLVLIPTDIKENRLRNDELHRIMSSSFIRYSSEVLTDRRSRLRAPVFVRHFLVQFSSMEAVFVSFLLPKKTMGCAGETAPLLVVQNDKTFGSLEKTSILLSSR